MSFCFAHTEFLSPDLWLSQLPGLGGQPVVPVQGDALVQGAGQATHTARYCFWYWSTESLVSQLTDTESLVSQLTDTESLVSQLTYTESLVSQLVDSENGYRKREGKKVRLGGMV